MTKIEVYKEFKTVIDFLRYGYYLQSAKNLFSKINTQFPKIDNNNYDEIECAKAFWISLTEYVFEDTIDANIIFNAMALYEENKQLGIVARRRFFIIASNYKGKETNLENISSDNKNLPDNIIERIEDKLSKTEKSNIAELIIRFMEIKDKIKFYYNACEEYTHFVPNKRYRCVDMSKYRLLPITSSQIFYVNRLKNIDFCGRESELKILKNNYKMNLNVQIIYGMGGCGKTQVALQYVYSQRNDYDAIIWIDASSYSDFIKSCKDFFKDYNDRVDLKQIKSLNFFIKCFCDLINSRSRCLIVVDNVDYLEDDTKEAKKAIDMLRTIIASVTSDFLITTRCDCDLNGVKRIKINTFDTSLSLEFMNKRTGLAIDKYAKILVDKLGNLPLALQYVSAYIKTNKISYKDYLKLWNDNGIRIFDQKDYAEKTIRQAFMISLDKIKQFKLPRYEIFFEFLKECAYLGKEYLPINTYINYLNKKEEQHINSVIDTIENNLFCIFELPDIYDGGKMKMYKYVEYLGDGRFTRREIPRFSWDGDVNSLPLEIEERSPLIVIMNDTIKRNEFIRKLSEYSLINWDGKKILIHSLLREIIIDMIPEEEREFWWDTYYDFDELSEFYNMCGDLQLYKKYKLLKLDKKLNQYYSIYDSSKTFLSIKGIKNHIVFQFITTCSSINSFIIDSVIPSSEKDLIKKSKKIHEKIVSHFYEVEYEYNCEKSIINEERDFWQKISNMVGRSLIYKNYNHQVVSNIQKNVNTYWFWHFNYVEPNSTAETNKYADYFVDIFMDGNKQEVIAKLKNCIRDKEANWYSIALPEGMTIKEEDIL